MDELLATVICGAGILGLVGLLGVAVWESARKGNRGGYKVLRGQCQELSALLYTVERQRDGLACRVNELERYLVPYAHLLQELDAGNRQRSALQHKNQDLEQRLAGARVLVLAMASRAGVTVDQDPGSGQWRAV